MVKKTSLEKRLERLEQSFEGLSLEVRITTAELRSEFREWVERVELRLQKKRRRRPRHCEESGETGEPATVKKPMAMRKSGKVEEKMKKSLGNLKLHFTDVAESVKQVDDELGTQQLKIEKGAFQWSDDNNNINVVAAVAGDFHALPPEPPEPPDRYVFTAKVREFYDSGAPLSFSTTDENDRGVAEWPLEEVKWDEEPSPAEPPPEEVSPESLLSSELEPMVIAIGALTEEKVVGSLLTFGFPKDGREVGPESTSEEEKWSGGDRNTAETAWEEGDEAVEVEEELLAGDLGSSSLTLAALLKDREWENELRVDWIFWELGFWSETMGQAQYLLVTPPQLTNTGRLLQEKKEVQKIVGLFLQAIYVIFPTAEHHIRIFNIPLHSYWATSLFDDHPPPTLAIKRLEELSLATFLLVKDGNGLSYSNINSFQLLLLKGVTQLIKCLVGFGFGQLIIIPILEMHPLVYKWDPGGHKPKEWDTSGLNMSLHETVTCVLESHGNHNLSFYINTSVGHCSNNVNNGKVWHGARKTKRGKWHPSALLANTFLGHIHTNMLSLSLPSHHPKAKHSEAIIDLNSLVKTTLQVIRLMFELESFTTYDTKDVAALEPAREQIPVDVYWTIITIAAIVTQIDCLTTKSEHEQELSHYGQNINIILSRLMEQITLCNQQIEEAKYYQKIRKLLQTPTEITEVLKVLNFLKDAPHSLFDGATKTTVDISVLKKKNVYLFVSTLDITEEEISVVRSVYDSIKINEQHKIIWIPIVEEWNEQLHKKFEVLKSKMPWYVVHNFKTIPGYKYIKEEWNFKKKPIVVLSPQGKVQHTNAFHLIQAYGIKAFPFTREAEFYNGPNAIVAVNVFLPLQQFQENTMLVFYGIYEENISCIKFEWHKLVGEHLIHWVETSTMATAKTHPKQWDPGEPYSTSCIIGTSCFKLWDPGGRPLTLLLSRYLHLEDKVNFKGGSIDENLALPNRFGKVCSRRGRIAINYRIRYLGGKSCNNLAESAGGNVLSEVHTFGVS